MSKATYNRACSLQYITSSYTHLYCRSCKSFKSQHNLPWAALFPFYVSIFTQISTYIQTHIVQWNDVL